MFNNFFTDIGVNLPNQIPKSNHGHWKYSEASYVRSKFFKPVLQKKSQVLLIIEKENSAAVWYDLTPKQMKTVTKFISKPLTHLCNISMTKGVFPRELKMTNIIP